MITIVLLTIALFAAIGYITRLQNRIDRLVISRKEWISAYYALLSDFDGTESDYHSAMRLYGHAITSEKIRAGHIPSTKIPYTVGVNGKQHTESIVALDMFSMPVGDYAPKFDSDGAIIYAPIAKIEAVTSEPKNGSKPKVESVKAIESAIPANGNSEPSNFSPPKLPLLTNTTERLLGRKLNKTESEWLASKISKWSANPDTTIDKMGEWSVKYFNAQSAK